VQYEQKENKRKATEHDQGLDEQHHDPWLEQHGQPDEDVNAVEVFKDFHTSTKKGPKRCFKSSSCKYLYLLSLKSTELIAIKEENVAGA
jgi:hypothetical protein